MNNFLLQWGITLLQGTTIFFLGLYTIAFTTSSFAVSGIFLLVAGLPGMAEWWLENEFDRSNTDFKWSIITALAGLLYIFLPGHGPLQGKLILLVWIMLTGIYLLIRGRSLKWISKLSWGLVLSGGCLAMAGLVVSVNIQFEISFFGLGMLFLLAGTGVWVLAIIKKKVFESF
jgi:uncharacterized membrane protein HdeD (DUF308 family)